MRQALLGIASIALSGSAWAATSLSEALDQALQYAPAVVSSEAQFLADRELAEQERSNRRPSVSAIGGAAYAHTESDGVFGGSEDDYPSWSASLQLRQPLFRLDWSAQGDRATAYEAQAQASYDERTLAIMSEVATAYFDVLLSEDGLNLAQSEAAAIREAFEDTQKRYDVELVPGTDLREAQARDDLAQARLITAKRALETARDALETLTGERVEALPRLSAETEFPALQPMELEPWRERALATSPALRSQRESVTIARTNLKSSKSARAPTVDMVASAGRDDSSEYDFGQTQDDARIGVELNVPIYAGGVNASQIRQADARYRAAQAELRRLELSVRQAVRRLFGDVETGYVEAKAYARALDSARVAETATQNGYDAGTRTITDVLEARSSVVEAQRNLNQTRYQLLLNILQLKQVVGVLRRQDFVEVDRLLVNNTPSP